MQTGNRVMTTTTTTTTTTTVLDGEDAVIAVRNGTTDALEAFDLTRAQFKRLAAALQTSRVLTALTIIDFPLDEASVRAICSALEGQQSLTALELCDDALGDNGSVCLCRSLKRNHTLLSLDLAGNDIGPNGAVALEDALLSNNTLTALRLACNQLGADGTRIVTRGLAKNQSLKEISLCSNSIGDEGARYISGLLSENTPLASLAIRHNAIGDDGIILVANALTVNRHLTSLHIQGNEFGERGLRALAAALQTDNTSLTTLSDEHSPWSYFASVYDEIDRSIRRNIDMRKLLSNAHTPYSASTDLTVAQLRPPRADGNEHASAPATRDVFLIAPDDIIVREALPGSDSGQVARAVYKGAAVVVKPIAADADLSALRVRPHPALLLYYGICPTPAHVYLVMDECLGSLSEFLLATSVPEQSLVHLAADVAAAMAHLEGYKALCELTVQRILVAASGQESPQHLQAKVAAFPSKPDVTAAACVWSFGLLLRDMFQPIPDGSDAAISILSPRIRDLIEQCWLPEPVHRPGFARLCSILRGSV